MVIMLNNIFGTALAVVLLTGQSEAQDKTCVTQPFCARLSDCCETHSECFSMCCGGSGSCIETKFCYSDLKSSTSLISTPQSSKLTPAVNSTVQPYIKSDKTSSITPCFMYAELPSG